MPQTNSTTFLTSSSAGAAQKASKEIITCEGDAAGVDDTLLQWSIEDFFDAPSASLSEDILSKLLDSDQDPILGVFPDLTYF